jgi:prepilin-type N-terminal cleavage/methylation domain-containing protein
MKKNFSQKNSGFTLVETLVAIAIFSISILGILSVLASGITNTTYAKDKMIGGYLAQEGIEYMRNLRDNEALFPANGGWSAFISTMTTSPTICTSAASPCGFNSTSMPISFFTCANDSLGCKLYLNNGVYNDTAGGTYSGFTRKVWVNIINSNNEAIIYSEVDWKQGVTNTSVILSENLFNWE